MLQPGVIEEFHSPLRIPPVLVPKLDGSVHIRLEFRQWNTVSTFNVYSMPQIESLLHRVGQVQYLSTLDLAKGYWQMPLLETDFKK